jgi:hypothetical protein
MKKTLSILALTIASASFAADVTLSSVSDRGIDKSGVQLKIAGPVIAKITPSVAFTKVTNVYDRYELGAEYPVLTYGKFQTSVTGAGFYQVSAVGKNEYGANAGLKASYALTDKVSIVGFGEHTFKNGIIKDDNSVGMGVQVKF